MKNNFQPLATVIIISISSIREPVKKKCGKFHTWEGGGSGPGHFPPKKGTGSFSKVVLSHGAVNQVFLGVFLMFSAFFP